MVGATGFPLAEDTDIIAQSVRMYIYIGHTTSQRAQIDRLCPFMLIYGFHACETCY